MMLIADRLSAIEWGRAASPADPAQGFCLSRGEAWLDLLALAAEEPTTVVNRGRRCRLEPGQLLAPTSRFTGRWNWTTQAVRWYVRSLENAELVAVGCDPTGTVNAAKVLTILDFDYFRPAIPVLRDIASAGQCSGEDRGDGGALVLSFLRDRRGARENITPRTRAAVLSKTSGACTYCGVTLTTIAGRSNTYHVDHVLPVAKGGSDDVANLVPCCASCNAKKGAKTALRFMGAQS